MSRLTREEKKLYTDVFKQVDINGDGSLSLSEIERLCRELGYTFDQAEIKDLFAYFDTDNSGDVSLEEFLSAMQPVKRKDKRCATYRRMFKKMDKNKDGFLTAEEIQRGLSSAAEEDQLDISEVQQLIAEVDFNGDGKLNYEEFLTLLKTYLE